MFLRIPNKIDEYEIIREIGRTDRSEVFLAVELTPRRQVVIKRLLVEHRYDQEWRARFRQEADIVGNLEHSYIVPIYRFVSKGRQLPYIVMRYMQGGTLDDYISHQPFQPLPRDKLLHMLHRVTEALDAAHKKNVIHRDLKPRNILFDEHRNAYLADFGIAKLASPSAIHTPSNIILGTLAYMSPEHCQDQSKLCPQSDVYSLGIILYEMLTGVHPYRTHDVNQLLHSIILEPVPQIKIGDLQRLQLPDQINKVFASALAKAPNERYSTAEEFYSAVHDLLSVQNEAANQYQGTLYAQFTKAVYGVLHKYTPGDRENSSRSENLHILAQIIVWIVPAVLSLVLGILGGVVSNRLDAALVTPTQTVTAEPTPLPTEIVIPTVTISPTPSSTESATVTKTVSRTPTITVTLVQSPTSVEPTTRVPPPSTRTSTATLTPQPTIADTPLPPPSFTLTPTNTYVPLNSPTPTP